MSSLKKRDLQVVWRPIDGLIPYARNARTHSDEQVAQIAASIKEFGWTNPVLVDAESSIVAGHGRVLAARKLGLTEVPTLALAGLSKAQIRAYVLADNKLAINAGWDDALLKIELGELKDDGFDLGLIGFSMDEIGELLADASATTEGNTDPDEVPEAPAKAVTQPGDLWLLGRHRLLCGDCRKQENVVRVMKCATAVLMNTDPPYGVNVAGGAHDPRDVDNYRSGGTIDGDALNDAELSALLCDAFNCAISILEPGSAWYVWYAGTKTKVFWDACNTLGGTRHVLVWVKPNFVFGRCDYHYKHEPFMYGWTPGAGHKWFGDHKQSSVWEIEVKDDTIEKKQHPSAKPVALFEIPIGNHTKPSEVVYEPFAGSGSQFIAAERTGRICNGLEISPVYCDVIVNRWQAFTGKKATLDGDGRTFEEVTKAREERAA